MSRNAPVICLGVLIAINIAMTAGLYFREPQAEPESDRIAVRIKASPDERRGVVEDFSGRIVERYPPRGRVPEAALPPSLDSELVDEIALQIVENYNSKDYAAIHELFDEIAKAEVTRDELEEQLRAAAGKFLKLLSDLVPARHIKLDAANYRPEPAKRGELFPTAFASTAKMR